MLFFATKNLIHSELRRRDSVFQLVSRVLNRKGGTSFAESLLKSELKVLTKSRVSTTHEEEKKKLETPLRITLVLPQQCNFSSFVGTQAALQKTQLMLISFPFDVFCGICIGICCSLFWNLLQRGLFAVSQFFCSSSFSSGGHLNLNLNRAD